MCATVHAMEVVAARDKSRAATGDVAQAAKVVAMSCDMHNLNNAAASLCVAIDECAKERLHFSDQESSAVEFVAAQEFKAGAEPGWSRFIHEVWNRIVVIEWAAASRAASSTSTRVAFLALVPAFVFITFFGARAHAQHGKTW